MGALFKLTNQQRADILDSLIAALCHAEECVALEKLGQDTGYKPGVPAKMMDIANRALRAWENFENELDAYDD